MVWVVPRVEASNASVEPASLAGAGVGPRRADGGSMVEDDAAGVGAPEGDVDALVDVPGEVPGCVAGRVGGWVRPTDGDDGSGSLARSFASRRACIPWRRASISADDNGPSVDRRTAPRDG